MEHGLEFGEELSNLMEQLGTKFVMMVLKLVMLR